MKNKQMEQGFLNKETESTQMERPDKNETNKEHEVVNATAPESARNKTRKWPGST